MRIARVSKDGRIGLAAKADGEIRVVWDSELADLDAKIAEGSLAAAGKAALRPARARSMPPEPKAGRASGWATIISIR